MQHFEIDGRILRVVPIEATDVREAAQHISAELPTPSREARAEAERLRAET